MTTANSFRVDRYSVFGADLDLTLLDTRRATAAALHLMNLRCGERVDIEAFVARLGPPVRQELARWIPEDRLDEAVHVFRTSFVESGVSQITLMPGAADLAAQLRRRGGRLIVITSRIQPIAEVCLASARLVPDAVIGGLTGQEKAAAIARHGVEVYIGDHVLDMEAALAAGVPGIGVTTGCHDAKALEEAGATAVVASLSTVVAALR
jgi:phosphoglycolate phosphatase